MASCYASDSLTRETFEVFDLMKKEGVKGGDVHVVSALVDMYVKNGNFCDARNAFDGMTARNVMSWNTLIVGYAQHGDVEKIQSTILAFLICLDELALPMRLEFSTSQPVACTPDTLGALVGAMYACKGRWLDMASVRKMTTDHCDYKIPGCKGLHTPNESACPINHKPSVPIITLTTGWTWVGWVGFLVYPIRSENK
ncbi:hypothetical protein F3Y22_tig00001349pilonHSYRG00082 [Hibiscus syriacus]|uniref:Pentatricopeptide repeat-containing protein n=1 Tax=Hibiscus syriacus TaxID=106335 RepID=A0A6A3CUT3_HIBSY|nr:hypothetical protein F3Y22_tig00001349pilonHSYRG00082 [Hibiscus syriacus]